MANTINPMKLNVVFVTDILYNLINLSITLIGISDQTLTGFNIIKSNVVKPVTRRQRLTNTHM